ncbi:MAG TPA: DUF2059 domain-containing protein [Candidatus Eisenbacteria bacterium]|nr:DUF2059 domain-containing protein [Candidatus Eisenbacteria bacterium]
MRKLATILIFVWTSSFGMVAQTKPADDTTPSKEQVLKFLDILRVKSQLTLYFNGVAKEAKLGAEEGFKRKVPDATPAQLAEVDEFAEKLFQGMPIDEMVDAMVPIYQRHLTRADIDGIMAFYSSPVGQKLQQEQPAMMQEGMKAGGEIGRRRLQTMMQQMDEFIAKKAQEQTNSTKP